MSIPKEPDSAKLVVSLFMNDKELFKTVFEMLETICGPTDLISRWLDFDFTSYYEKEMGKPLFRRVIAFKDLIAQEDLSRIKQETNAIEAQFVLDGRRQINIDPGYLLSSRFILATGKDYSHRIYIGRQIYADLTLIYSKTGFKSLEWTYPDYASKPMTGFLEKVRQKYLLDLKEKEKHK